MQLPDTLIEGVRTGNVVLVLGAGASIGASTSNGQSAPSAVELAKLLSNRFLGGAHTGDPLPIVAELAISESDLLTVQEYIRALFGDLEPAPFHELLPTFKWAGLATTNYDLVIERAYDRCDKRAQDIVPLIKNGDRINEKLRSHRSLMLLKLHGCITRTADTSVPLILSVDQYLTHRAGRDRIFGHLKELSYEHPIVFVGHSLRDPDIRQLLLELGDSDLRPRYYIVIPTATDPEKRFWDSKRISALEGTFEDFLNTLNDQISTPFRGIVPVPIAEGLPIAERFTVRNPGLSSECLAFLENDVEYVRNGMPIAGLNPPLFYRGFNPRWSAIDQDLDVRRDIEDKILLEAVLSEDGGRDCRLHTIRAHAGSGKSVLLQRVSWEAAKTYEKLCLYLQPDGRLSFDAIRELSKVIDERIHLFVDDIDEHVPEILELIGMAQRSSISLSIIGASRINEWNMSCEDLEPYVMNDFELGYLSAREIGSLLELLEKHNSLFRLEEASPEERRAAFTERAGRQLLVALHEATLGKPFEDIVADEFSAVQPDDARLIYLGVCFLNRFDVDVRAGIISRVYGVRFTEFKNHFFQPLEGLVFTKFDRVSRDYVYVTRHPHIAGIVVERALTRPTEKLDVYLQVINSMNIDYESDRRAFRKLVRGRSLLEEFPDHQMVEAIYTNARFKVRDDPYLYHQIAIYEMNRPDGNLQEANGLLTQAQSLAPDNRAIVHSLAELQLRRAEEAKTTLEFHKNIREAQVLARPLAGATSVDSHGFHTLAKSHIAKLRKIINGDDESATDIGVTDAIKDAEEALQEGLQRFPGDPYLLAAESDLGELLSDDTRSMNALRTAFEKNPHNPFIVVRLAKGLVSKNYMDEARAVYRRAIEAGVVDRHVHFNYAKLLIDSNDENGTDIEYHLRRSFTDGDRNSESQFWYARQLYINGTIDESRMRFSQLKLTRGNPVIKRKVRGLIFEGGQAKRFSGSVDRILGDYGFVIRDGLADAMFLHPNNIESHIWNHLERGVRITFSVGFNYWGPTATDADFESSLRQRPHNGSN